jgi:aryl-alcohol dehydrogenase-like predicted oxidoreductase
MYFVHYPDTDIPIEETIGAMTEIKDKGKIRHIVVSNFSAEQLSQAASTAYIACCQPAYNLMWREIEDGGILDGCQKNNIGVLTYSSLGQGLFTGKIRSLDDIPKREGDIRQFTLLFKEDAFKGALEIVKMQDRLSDKYNKTPAQIAINWVINQHGITSAIVGSKNMGQLKDNLDSVGWKMDREDYELLSREGSRISKMFDYSYSMFGMKYDEIKVDAMIDASL